MKPTHPLAGIPQTKAKPRTVLDAVLNGEPPPPTPSPFAMDPDQPMTEPNGRIAGDLEEKLSGIFKRSEIFENELGSAPDTMRCFRCGHDTAVKNEDKSWKVGMIAYDCAKCAEDDRQQRIGAAIERAGIPSDVRHATLANYVTDRPNVQAKAGQHTPTQFLEAAKRFCLKGDRNLVLAGSVGIGKGHLAAALAKYFIEQNWKVAWIECARLFRDYHRAYKDCSHEAIADRLGTVGLLVLDEICLRDLPADGEEILFSILDQRHKGGRPTIMLANKPAAEIKAWLGDRITDRLRSGGVSFCYGEWESMRGRPTDSAHGNGGF